MSFPATAVDTAAGFTPAGLLKAIFPYIVLLIIAVILIIVIFGAKPTIGGLQL